MDNRTHERDPQRAARRVPHVLIIFCRLGASRRKRPSPPRGCAQVTNSREWCERLHYGTLAAVEGRWPPISDDVVWVVAGRSGRVAAGATAGPRCSRRRPVGRRRPCRLFLDGSFQDSSTARARVRGEELAVAADAVEPHADATRRREAARRRRWRQTEGDTELAVEVATADGGKKAAPGFPPGYEPPPRADHVGVVPKFCHGARY
jgi:hypothetical protein